MPQQTTDHYAVLGVEATATTDDIKKAYRRKARELHPDVNPEGAEAFKRVTHANDVLSDPDKRAHYDYGRDTTTTGSRSGSMFDDLFDHFTYDYMRNDGPSRGYADWGERFTRPNVEVPQPEEFLYQGVNVRVTYDTDGYRDQILVADLSIQLDDILKMSDLPDPTHKVTRVRQVHIMQGEERLTTVWADDSYARLRDEASKLIQQKELDDKLQQLVERLHVLTRKGLPVGHADRLLDQASRDVRSMTNQYGWSSVSYSTALAHVRSLEKEIERLEAGDPTELLVDGLVSGTLMADVTVHNQRVMEQVQIFSIRSGGQYDEITDEDLREFYRERLNGARSTRQLSGVKFMLDPDDYMFEDDELAPRQLVLPTRKGEKVYDVTYSFGDLNGEKTATGAIEVPQSVFEQFAADYGKKHSFPDLAHGIKLWVSVRIAGDKIVGGWADDKDLIKRVEKRKKGLGRKSDGIADAPTPPPPWARGQAARSRRR